MPTIISASPGDVRSRRRAAGLSQLDVAERAHCALSSVRLFDRGYTPGHSEALERVLAVLDEAEAKTDLQDVVHDAFGGEAA